jgi:Nuclease-related domain
MLILNNLVLPELGGDIELLIIGGTGLFLAELKAWSGAISCSPDAQTRALRDYLQHADPDLCRRTQLWIDGFIVFAHPRARVDARCSPVPALTPNEALARIRDKVPRGRLSLADQKRVVALVESVQLNGLVRETQAGAASSYNIEHLIHVLAGGVCARRTKSPGACRRMSLGYGRSTAECRLACTVGWCLGWASALLTNWLHPPEASQPVSAVRRLLLRDPIVQSASALVWGGIPIFIPGDWWLWVEAGLLALPLIQVAVTDMRTRYVYTVVALIGLCLGLAFGWQVHHVDWWTGLAGAAGGFGSFGALYLFGL